MASIDPGEVERAKQVYREKALADGGSMGGSTSFLQRKMQWGYNHAAMIVEELEAQGWLSEPDRTGRRTILGK